MNWHADAYIAIHTALLDEIDAAGATCYVEICDSSDVVLSTLPLDYPAGAVNGTTGQLVMAFGARDEEAANGGTASYGRLKDHADKIWLDEVPCSAGSTPVANTLVLTSLTVVAGAPVEGISFTIG